MGRVQRCTQWGCGLLNLGETFQMLLSGERREPRGPDVRCPECSGSQEARLETLSPAGECRVREEVDGTPGETGSVFCHLGDKVYLYKRDKLRSFLVSIFQVHTATMMNSIPVRRVKIS